MRKLLLLFFILAMGCNASAQSKCIYVRLFTGEIHYGELIEHKEGESMSLRDGDGNTLLLEARDIVKIAQSEEELNRFERKKAKTARAAYEAKVRKPSSNVANDSLASPANAAPTNHLRNRNASPTPVLSSPSGHSGEPVMLRAQTTIPMKASQEVLARKVLVGDKIPFIVSTNIYQEGNLVIPAGTKAYARVTKARKSIPFGIQGRLEFVMDYLELSNGQRIYLEGREIKIKGKNRSRMSIGIAFVTLGIGYIIPGKKAVLPQGYEVVAHTLSEQEILM